MLLVLIWWYLMDIAKFILGKSNIIWTIDDLIKSESNLKSNLYDKNSICLTIDDIVNNDSFEEILNILDEYNVKVTFFVISSLINQYNQFLLIKAVQNGHHLANHGHTNILHVFCTYEQIEFEINECDKLIKNIYSIGKIQEPIIKYFRPGHGIVNRNISDICKKLGFIIVLGSVYPSDTKLPFPNLLAWYIIIKSKPNDIIILHDRKHNVSTLKKMIPHLQKKFSITHLKC